MTDALATVSPYQYALNDPVANIDMDGLDPMRLLCPATSGLGIFAAQVGNVLSHVADAVSVFGAAIAPLEGAISASAKVLSLADITTNMVAGNREINNFFTDKGVGEKRNTNDRDEGCPGCENFFTHQEFGVPELPSATNNANPSTASEAAGFEPTWDPITNRRIAQLDPRLQVPASTFINRVEKELNIKLRVAQGRRTIAEQILYMKLEEQNQVEK